MAEQTKKNPFQKIRDLVEEGNQRTVVVRKAERVVVEMPLGNAVLLTIVASIVAAPLPVVALVALLVSNATLTVEPNQATPNMPADNSPPAQQ